MSSLMPNGIGTSVLHRACQKGRVEVVKFLLEDGLTNVNETVEGDLTPLHVAADNGTFEVVKCLIENGARVTKLEYLYVTQTKND